MWLPTWAWLMPTSCSWLALSPVESVLAWLASGMTVDDILSDCEDLNREGILAVLTAIHVCQMPLRTESIAAMMS